MKKLLLSAIFLLSVSFSFGNGLEIDNKEKVSSCDITEDFRCWTIEKTTTITYPNGTVSVTTVNTIGCDTVAELIEYGQEMDK